MRKRTLSRILVLSGCLALLVATAAPVMGKGKPEKPAPSTPVIVTMSFEGAGLATTCGGPLAMTQDSSGFMRADWTDVETGLEMALPIAWERSHPAAQSGTVFEGCHGGPVEGSGEGFMGYFILDPNPDGSLHLTSRFDYYWEYGTATKGKSGRTIQTVLEFFEINGDLTVDGGVFDWSAYGAAQTVVGTVELRWFEKVPDDDVLWTTLGFVPVTITITIDTV